MTDKSNWKLVPVDLTEAMADAGLKIEDTEHGGLTGYIEDVWAAMLDAAPASPSPTPSAGVDAVAGFQAGLDAAAEYLLACGDYGDPHKAVEIRKLPAPSALSPAATPVSEAPVDPDRLLKDTLFALLKTGREASGYSGVLVDGGRYASIYFAKHEQGEIIAVARVPNNLASSTPVSEAEPVAWLYERDGEKQLTLQPSDMLRQMGYQQTALAKPASSPAGGAVREAVVADAVIDHTAAEIAGLVGANDEAKAVEEAVKRALVFMRSVFTARLSSPATPEPALAGGVRVKALEWVEQGLSVNSTWRAESSFGRYLVYMRPDNAWAFEPPGRFGGKVGFKSPNKAMAAAQADYEARIRSALTPAPAPDQKEAGE